MNKKELDNAVEESKDSITMHATIGAINFFVSVSSIAWLMSSDNIIDGSKGVAPIAIVACATAGTLSTMFAVDEHTKMKKLMKQRQKMI